VQDQWVKFNSASWIAGFLPGVYWLLYKASGQAAYQQAAYLLLEGLRYRQSDTSTHDIGFVLINSF